MSKQEGDRLPEGLPECKCFQLKDDSNEEFTRVRTLCNVVSLITGSLADDLVVAMYSANLCNDAFKFAIEVAIVSLLSRAAVEDKTLLGTDEARMATHKLFDQLVPRVRARLDDCYKMAAEQNWNIETYEAMQEAKKEERLQ